MVQESINLYYYSFGNNFGDMLSPLVISWLSCKKVNLTGTLTKGKVIGIGSVLRAVQENDVIWSTGTNVIEDIILPKNVKVLALRGPLTRKLIKNNDNIPEIYGDGALLLPEIYKPKKLEKRYNIGLLPHEVDKELIKIPNDNNILNIDINTNVFDIIDKINSCDVIISSSLHGIIVSEVYGIPAVWVGASGRVIGAIHKFNDYFLSTGRDYQNPMKWETNNIPNKILPKPIINTEKLKSSWYEYYGNK